MQERLKGLRAERGLTLERLAEQTHHSKSALGGYEADDFKDSNHYALIKLAKFYGVTTEETVRENSDPEQASQAELQEAVRRGKEVVEKSKPTAGEKMRN